MLLFIANLAAFLTQTVSLEGEEKQITDYKFEIWDTAGQERYRSLAPMYYRGAAAAIVVYDVTDDETFDGATTWIKELHVRADPSVVIALVGNKADVTTGRKVLYDDALTYACKCGYLRACYIIYTYNYVLGTLNY